MQKRLYVLVTVFLMSSIVFMSSTFSSDKIIEVEYTQLTKDARKQVDCLADNIYFEAGHEPEKGRVAVALVTLNRVQDPRYPKDICSVVKQRVKSTCQFSWFCEEGKRVSNSHAYREARRIAIFVYANYDKIKDVTHGALFYHADYVNPRWRGLEKTTVIGRHIFYKESGKL
jgi:spore germination cell wall hydrolase CwlJ-like protein